MEAIEYGTSWQIVNKKQIGNTTRSSMLSMLLNNLLFYIWKRTNRLQASGKRSDVAKFYYLKLIS